MIPAEYLFTAGNLLFLMASYPLIKEAYKNKSSLNGFSLNGSVYTALGMIIMIGGFIVMNSTISVILAIPTLLFWITVSYYKIANKN